jgi:predicted histone-like DNA-binding protein
MVMKLKKIERLNPANRDERLWYATKDTGKTVDLKRISAEIEKRTTATRADITGILISLLEIIPEYLRDGDTVKLDGFGLFRVNVSSAPSPSAEEVSARSVKGVKITFLPSTEMKAALATATFAVS